jgi:dTDP-4-dehydrorhamnose reductase
LILVTGASGLLGANFISTALQRGKTLVAVSHEHPLQLLGIEHVSANLVDRCKVNELVQSIQPAWIVHCAALTNVDWCQCHPKETWGVNVEISKHLATAARSIGARMVYVSTDSVFDGRVGNYNEADLPKPLNVYGESKLAGEKAVLEELQQSLIVRTNIYGWNAQDKASLAEWMFDRLEGGQCVPGFRDVIFTPILVNDLSEIILDMMEHRLRGVHHVAGSQPCSKYEFALQLASAFGLERELVQPQSLADSNLLAPRPKRTSLQTTKVSGALGRKMPDVQSGLQRFKALRDSGFVRKLKGFTAPNHGGN